MYQSNIAYLVHLKGSIAGEDKRVLSLGCGFDEIEEFARLSLRLEVQHVSCPIMIARWWTRLKGLANGVVVSSQAV